MIHRKIDYAVCGLLLVAYFLLGVWAVRRSPDWNPPIPKPRAPRCEFIVVRKIAIYHHPDGRQEPIPYPVQTVGCEGPFGKEPIE